jgi:hypothetical protein
LINEKELRASDEENSLKQESTPHNKKLIAMRVEIWR